MSAALALPPAATCRAVSRSPMDARPWMGKPIGSLPDDELAEILAVLEDVAFGEVRTRHRLQRPAMIRRVYELDVMLEAGRPL